PPPSRRRWRSHSARRVARQTKPPLPPIERPRPVRWTASTLRLLEGVTPRGPSLGPSVRPEESSFLDHCGLHATHKLPKLGRTGKFSTSHGIDTGHENYDGILKSPTFTSSSAIGRT